MRTTDSKNQAIETTESVEASKSTEFSSEFKTEWSQATYHEMADVPVVQMDALSQLHANLALVEDMQARLAFMMREIRYQMKF